MSNSQKRHKSPQDPPPSAHTDRNHSFVRHGAVIASAVAVTLAGIGFSASASAAPLTASAAAIDTASFDTASIGLTAATSFSIQPSRRKPKPTPTPTSTPTPTPTPTPTATPAPPPTADAGWDAVESMPAARTGQVSVVLHDGRVLVAGGTAGTSAVLYTPSTRTWTSAAPMLRPVTDGSATTLADGRVLVVGGGSAATQLYNPSTDTWTAGASLPKALHWTSVGLFPDGQVIVVGRAAGETPAAVMYSPASDSIRTLPAPASPSQMGPEVGLMLPNGSFFTTFGRSGTSMYTPSTNGWTNFRAAPTTLPDKLDIALMPNGNVMVAGGTNWGFGFATPITSVLELNPTTGTWQTDPRLPRDSVYQSPYLFDGAELVTLADGQILATGGVLSGDQDYLFTQGSDAWVAVPGRNAHGGTLLALADGSVLAAGGYVDTAVRSPGTVTDQAFIFHP